MEQTKSVQEQAAQQGLYSPSFEHDNCGIGAIVNIKGKKSHQIVDDALKIVEQAASDRPAIGANTAPAGMRRAKPATAWAF